MKEKEKVVLDYCIAEELVKNKENLYLKMIKNFGNYIIRNLQALYEVI